MDESIVILGGTFDPVHHGHLIVARSVAEHLGAQKVMLMPANLPPHKSAVTAGGQHRLAMLRLAVKGDALFEVSTLELDRTGPSYTFDTIQQLRQLHGDDANVFWIIGLDMLQDLATWYRAAEVVDLATIVTAARPPWPTELPAHLGRHFTAEQVARLTQHMFATPLMDISSREIRQRVRDGKSIRYLTSDPVVDYIREHHLYL